MLRHRGVYARVAPLDRPFPGRLNPSLLLLGAILGQRLDKQRLLYWAL